VQQHFDIGHSLRFEVCCTLIMEWMSQGGATPQQQYENPLCVCVCMYIYIYIYKNIYHSVQYDMECCYSHN